jgi:UDP-glucose 4-epimerase
VNRSFLFLGYGAISKRVIHELLGRENPVIYLITDRQVPLDLPRDVKILPSSNSRDLLLTNSFDIVINSWRTLSSDTQTDRRQLLLSLARKSPRKTQFINFSTVAVYGDSPDIHTESSQLNPINFYGLEKLEIEEFLQSVNFFSVHNLRISNVFGDVDLNDVVNRIILAAKNNSEIFLTDPSHLYRDFIHIDDLIHHVIKIIDSSNIMAFDTMHIARGSSTSLLELFEVCNNHFGKKLTFFPTNRRTNEILVSRISVEKLRSRYPVKMEPFDVQLMTYLEGPF